MGSFTDQQRLDVLLDWKNQTDGHGHRTPSLDSLKNIASTKSVPDHPDEDAVGQWRDTLAWLLHQLKMGVFDPVTQLPPELLIPRTSVPPMSNAQLNDRQNGADPISAVSSTPPSAGSSRLDALKEWRKKAIADGRTEVFNLKESTLAQVARSNRTAVEDIAPMIPLSLRGLTPEILGVLAEVIDTRPEASATVPPQVDSSPPTAQHDPPRASAASLAAGVATTGSTAGETASTGDRRRRASSTLGTFLDLSNEDFEDFDFSTTPTVVHAVKVSTQSGSGIVYSWPTYEVDEQDVVVYRVVTNDEYAPYAPERATYVGATMDTKVAENRGFESAVRHIQVWVNVGSNLDEALESQPTLHSQTALVSPVSDVEIREDEGRVIGQWSVFPGISAVQVSRIPIERAAFGGDDPQYRIGAGELNLGGFVDRTAERGKRYIYRVRAEAEIDGTTRLSTHIQTELLLSAVLDPVTDLRVTVHGDDGDPQFDLVWSTPPAGRVLIYRTVSGPNPGADAAPLPEAALAEAGLPVDGRLSHPVVADTPGTSSMLSVPWPRDWNRAYFTAVTLLGDRVQVGSTTSATRTGLIQQAEVIERVNKQVLTFAWPAGAASVLVHMGIRGHTAEQGVSGQPIEISSGMYERFGGLHFAHPLPYRGCSLHLIPVAFAAGERIYGDPVTVDYPGLLRVHYDSNITRNVTGKAASVAVTVVAEMEVDGSPPFVLIHNEDRLPLSSRDGNALDVVQVGNDSAPPTKQFVLSKLTVVPSGIVFRADVKDKIGFVRLFAQMPASRLTTFALIDPAISKLTLHQGRRRR